ncbi:MAG: hypothetical protein KC910_36925 [Candidatus Eremiobacteraeota bacterium]|nr:hypothetical protein [Candidatus Eremiobacteraeota bacterium]
MKNNLLVLTLVIVLAALVVSPTPEVAAESTVWSGIEVPVPMVEGMVCPHCGSRRAQPVDYYTYSCTPEDQEPAVRAAEAEAADRGWAFHTVDPISPAWYDWRCLGCGRFFGYHSLVERP